MRKLRVWYSDPDATDNSSDEDDRRKIVKESPVPVKRLVHLIDLADVPILREIIPNKRRRVSNNRPSKSPYVGVRQRKWGTWAAEIRNPFTKTRTWLGTFGSAEEAREAYLAKRAEFDAQAVASSKQKEEKQQPVVVSRPSSQLESDCSVDIGSSDSSNSVSKKFWDTDLGNRRGIISMLELGSAIIDNNGFLLGEFSHLDDLWICDVEEGNPD